MPLLSLSALGCFHFASISGGITGITTLTRTLLLQAYQGQGAVAHPHGVEETLPQLENVDGRERGGNVLGREEGVQGSEG